MTSNSTKRALRPTTRPVSRRVQNADAARRSNQSAPRDDRAQSAQMQAQTGATMSYQQGFTSGPMT